MSRDSQGKHLRTVMSSDADVLRITEGYKNQVFDENEEKGSDKVSQENS